MRRTTVAAEAPKFLGGEPGGSAARCFRAEGITGKAMWAESAETLNPSACKELSLLEETRSACISGAPQFRTA